MSSYNEARWTRQFLKRHRKVNPSLVVHLYHTHFRFEQQVRALRRRFRAFSSSPAAFPSTATSPMTVR